MSKTLKKPIISFDLDGTLMKPGFGDKVWLEGLPRIYAITHNLDIEEAKKQLISAYDTIGQSRREWYDLSYWIKSLDLRITPEELLTNFIHDIEPYPDVVDVIKRLSKKYRLVISSAAMKPFITIELKTTKLDKYFSEFFSATSDTHTVKKDPYFYQMIIDRLKCQPQEIVHVGDNYEFDYLSPIKAGLHAFYLDRSTQSTNEKTVRSLTEFEEKITKYLFH